MYVKDLRVGFGFDAFVSMKCFLLVSDSSLKGAHTSHLLDDCDIEAVQSEVYTGDVHLASKQTMVQV